MCVFGVLQVSVWLTNRLKSLLLALWPTAARLKSAFDTEVGESFWASFKLSWGQWGASEAVAWAWDLTSLALNTFKNKFKYHKQLLWCVSYLFLVLLAMYKQ